MFSRLVGNAIDEAPTLEGQHHPGKRPDEPEDAPRPGLLNVTLAEGTVRNADRDQARHGSRATIGELCMLGGMRSPDGGIPLEADGDFPEPRENYALDRSREGATAFERSRPGKFLGTISP